MEDCRVYWGSHGCGLQRGHDGDCECPCAAWESWQGEHNVGAPPYYGPDTWFYGEDADSRRPLLTRPALDESALRIDVFQLAVPWHADPPEEWWPTVRITHLPTGIVTAAPSAASGSAREGEAVRDCDDLLSRSRLRA